MFLLISLDPTATVINTSPFGKRGTEGDFSQGDRSSNPPYKGIEGDFVSRDWIYLSAIFRASYVCLFSPRQRVPSEGHHFVIGSVCCVRHGHFCISDASLLWQIELFKVSAGRDTRSH